MMTKYEVAKQILADNNLPPSQVDNLGVIEGQILDLALKLYTTKLDPEAKISLEDAKDAVQKLVDLTQFFARFLLVVGVDIHRFRAESLARIMDLPPEMRVDDVVARIVTRDCDLPAQDAVPDGENAVTEKGKEKGKEESSPHTPLKEKGKEESQKEPLSRARVRKDDPAFMSFFNKFWERYPRKVSKQAAKDGLFAYWKRRVKRSEFENEVLTSLDKWRSCEQWKDPLYIPHPSTWVHQKRWMVIDDSINLKRPQKPQRGVSQTANVKSNRAGGLW